MPKIFTFLFISCSLFLFSSYAKAQSSEPIPLRLGIGLLQINIQDAPKHAPNHRNFGGLVFAEYSESNHAGSRFIIYNYDHKEAHLTGVETQLLFGYGLANQGLRAYTGPTWFIEHLHMPHSKKSHTFKGLAWQIGLGWQYRAITLDYAVSMRQRRSYERHFSDDNIQIGEVFNQKLLLSYHF